MNIDKLTLFSFLPSLLLYICFFAGLLMLTHGELYLVYKRIDARHRLKKAPKRNKNKVFVFLENLMASALGKDIRGENAALAELSLFLLIFLFASRNFPLVIAFVCSLAIALLPVLMLFSRLQASRSKGSNEGISFVSELNRQYRIRNKNIFEALRHTCENDSEFKICGRQAYKLLIHLQSAGSVSEAKASIKQFSFALGTVWGSMLASCIRVSVEKGTDISAGLADIVEQLERANARVEERRRLNSESARMTVFLVPVLYVGTALLSGKYLGTELRVFIRNQFFTPEGFLFFMVIVFLFFLNLVFIRLVTNSGLDL